MFAVWVCDGLLAPAWVVYCKQQQKRSVELALAPSPRAAALHVFHLKPGKANSGANNPGTGPRKASCSKERFVEIREQLTTGLMTPGLKAIATLFRTDITTLSAPWKCLSEVIVPCPFSKIPIAFVSNSGCYLALAILIDLKCLLSLTLKGFLFVD